MSPGQSKERRGALHDDDLSPDFDLRRAYMEHGRVLYGFAFNGLGDHGLAEDCVQETFVRAWRARERYRAERSSERTWLFAIARNVVIDALRARARRPRVIDSDAGEGPGEPLARQTDEQVEDRIVLLAGLAQLTVDHREVILAVQVEGLRYEQLSERTGVPVGTLRTRMYYGLRALRETLEGGDDHA